MSVAFPRYVVVEGVIGVGKTTLVNGLATELNARTVFESFDENPFLEAFYADQARNAFATEMFFLVHRFNQQELFAQEDLIQRHAVSDYLFEKCRIFAGLTLNAHELTLFDRVYDILLRQIPTPDLVLYLHAPVPVLEDRIARRGRSYEKSIDPGYLMGLDRRYREHMQRTPADRLVSLDTTTVDFRDAGRVRRLMDLVGSGLRGEFQPAWFMDEPA